PSFAVGLHRGSDRGETGEVRMNKTRRSKARKRRNQRRLSHQYDAFLVEKVPWTVQRLKQLTKFWRRLTYGITVAQSPPIDYVTLHPGEKMSKKEGTGDPVEMTTTAEELAERWDYKG